MIGRSRRGSGIRDATRRRSSRTTSNDDHRRRRVAIQTANSGATSSSQREGRLLDDWRKLYDATAKSDDWLVVHRWDYDEGMAVATAEEIRGKLELQPTDRILEVGCASGKKLSMVIHPQQTGYGFDLCESLVARKADFVAQPERLQLGVAEAARLPVASNAFDKVFCYSVAQCFPSAAYARDVVREMVRVCRPGGIVLMGDILGEMERHRRFLTALKLPVPLADAILWVARPVWALRNSFRTETDGMRRRVFRRSFFRSAVAGIDCVMDFLPQIVSGRRFVKSRYDVWIRKGGADAANRAGEARR